MQKRSHLYQSKDPFVFYFSPNIEVETKVVAGKKDNKMIKIGFFKEGKVRYRAFSRFKTYI